MSKQDVSARLTVIRGQDDPKTASLTRHDVATRLGVSVSTVRRLEGSRLHPVVTDKGVHRFAADAVERLAASLNAEQATPRNMEKAATRAVELSKGELAALVFERLEQRHSLAEIVITLRVPPDEVRALYHTWLVGLWSGELQRPDPALPMRHSDQDTVRRVTQEELVRMLAALPEKQPTRLSLARTIGEYVIPENEAANANFVEYRNLNELGGFIVKGPVSVSEITDRFGAGEYRVSAFGLEDSALRWEVFVTLVLRQAAHDEA